MGNFDSENPTPAEIRETFFSLPKNIEQETNNSETLEDIEIDLRKQLARVQDPNEKKQIETDLKRITILIKQQKVVDLEMKKATSTKYTFGRDENEPEVDSEALKNAKTKEEAEAIIDDAKKKKRKKREQEYQELPNEFDDLIVDTSGKADKVEDREKGGHERQERTR